VPSDFYAIFIAIDQQASERFSEVDAVELIDIEAELDKCFWSVCSLNEVTKNFALIRLAMTAAESTIVGMSEPDRHLPLKKSLNHLQFFRPAIFSKFCHGCLRDADARFEDRACVAPAILPSFASNALINELGEKEEGRHEREFPWCWVYWCFGWRGKELIEESCEKQCIQPGQLTPHAGRGTSVSSNAVASRLANLGVTKTHSRLHVSDDNPYSESQFRTIKYRPEFPDRFGCIQARRAFSQGFLRWYNTNTATPGWTGSRRRWFTTTKPRQAVLDATYRVHPERFVRQAPNQQWSRPRSGSTNRPTQMKKLTKLHSQWSQTR
jgi:hypothetical protein